MAERVTVELENLGERIIHIVSPRLAHPEQAADFQLEIVDIDDVWSETDLREFHKACLHRTMMTFLLDEQD